MKPKLVTFSMISEQDIDNMHQWHLLQALHHLHLTQGIPGHLVFCLNHEVKDLPDKRERENIEL